MHRSSVLFPEPDGPMMHTTSPACTVALIPLRTSLWPKCLDRSRISSSGFTESSGMPVSEGHEPTKRRLQPLDQRRRQTLLRRAPAEVPLDVVLANRQDRSEDQVPEAGNDEQRNGLEGASVDALCRVQELGQRRDADQA